MSFNAAQPLLAFVRKTETGFSDERAYDTMYGHKKISPVLTKLTLDQAIAAGPGWTRAHKSSAAGAYQFMNATLKDLKRSLGLSGSMTMTPFEQDELGYALLKRRGFEKFLAGSMSLEAFGKALAQEWASFPVLAATNGGSRAVQRGQSYYAGDGLNKALVKPEEVEQLLLTIRGDDAPEPTEPIPTKGLPPAQKLQRAPTWLIVLVVIALAAAAFASFLTGAHNVR